MYRARWSFNSFRGISIAAACAWVALLGCSSSESIPDDQSRGSAAPPTLSQGAAPDRAFIDPESAPRSEVAVIWRDAETLSGATLGAAETLVVDVQNATPNEVHGRIFLVAAGLDSRRIKRPVQDFTLSGKDRLEVKVPVGALPVQSENSTSRIRVHVEIDRPNGQTVQSFTPPLYYKFQENYAKAQFFSDRDIGNLPGGGVTTQNLLDVQGRIIDTDGTVREAAAAAAAAAEEAARTGGGRVGLTGFGRARADGADGKETPKRNAVPVKASALKAPDQAMPLTNTITLCTTWATDFADSGMGEDFLDPANNGYTSAAHTGYWITNAGSWSTVYANGWLDAWGCASVTLAPGDYWVWRFTDEIGTGGVTFQAYYMSESTEYYDYDYTGFTVDSGTSWVNTYPWWNDDTIQVAAIATVVASRQQSVGLGMPSGNYKIHVNEGCGSSVSCYNSGTNVTSISPDAIGGGASHAAWKHIVAHEFGHHVQFLAMGYPGYGYTLSSSYAHCRCDHYDTYWGNTIHCIQSREEIGGAALEGYGHAFAARVFNNTSQTNATFGYYKPFLNPWYDTDYPPLSFDAYNSYQWMESRCPASDQGTEIDWLNFVYGITNEASSYPTTMANLFSVYRRACGNPSANCNDQTVSWSALNGAAQTHFGTSSPYYTRFNSTGAAAGVDN
jgi:hypothetical protein